LGSRRRADAIIVERPDTAWQTVTWWQGIDGPLSKQFVALWAWPSHGDRTGTKGWLVGERLLPRHTGDCKYYWSNLPTDTALARLDETGLGGLSRSLVT